MTVPRWIFIVGILGVVVMNSIGCPRVLLYAERLAADARQVNHSLGALTTVVLLLGIGAVGTIALSWRYFRWNSRAADERPGDELPEIANDEGDTRQLRLAIVARFVLAASVVAYGAARHPGLRSIGGGVLDALFHEAPFIVVFVYLFRKTLHPRAVIVAIMYGFVELFTLIRLWGFPIGAAVDLWIAIAALLLFARWTDRRNATREFVLTGVASAVYVLAQLPLVNLSRALP